MYNEQLMCPVCLKKLEMKLTSYGNIYYCHECKAKMVNIAIMRKVDSKNKFIGDLWKHADKFPSMNRKCPACNEYMKRVEMDIGGRDIAIDMCKKCNIIWLDENEFEQIVNFCEWREATQCKITKEQANELSESFKKYYQERIDIDLIPGEKPHVYGYTTSGRFMGGWFGFFLLGNPTDKMPSIRERKHALTIIFCVFTLIGGFVDFSVYNFFSYRSVTVYFVSIYYLYSFGARIENYNGRIHLAIVFLSSLFLTGVFTVNTYELFDGMLIAYVSATTGVIAFYTAMYPESKGSALIFAIRSKMSIIPLAIIWFIIILAIMGIYSLIGIFVGLLIGYIYKKYSIEDNYEGEES